MVGVAVRVGLVVQAGSLHPPVSMAESLSTSPTVAVFSSIPHSTSLTHQQIQATSRSKVKTEAAKQATKAEVLPESLESDCHFFTLFLILQLRKHLKKDLFVQCIK